MRKCGCRHVVEVARHVQQRGWSDRAPVPAKVICLQALRSTSTLLISALTCTKPGSTCKLISSIRGREKHTKSGEPVFNSTQSPPSNARRLPQQMTSFGLQLSSRGMLGAWNCSPTPQEWRLRLENSAFVSLGQWLDKPTHRNKQMTRRGRDGLSGTLCCLTEYWHLTPARASETTWWWTSSVSPHHPASRLLGVLLALPHLVTLAELQGGYSTCLQTLGAKKGRKRKCRLHGKAACQRHCRRPEAGQGAQRDLHMGKSACRERWSIFPCEGQPRAKGWGYHTKINPK